MKKILLVDDNDMVRVTFEAILQDAGYSVSTAVNGRHALEILENSPELPAVVITDIVMPEMTGIELAQVIKEKNIGVSTLIISGGGHQMTGDLFDEAKKVSDFFLKKPFTDEELVGAIEDILKN